MDASTLEGKIQKWVKRDGTPQHYTPLSPLSLDRVVPSILQVPWL